MLTDGEARNLYIKFLEELRKLGAISLARDIEVMILRGTPRKASLQQVKNLAQQTPLSPREGLAVAGRNPVSSWAK
jgi:hypothetical protein